MAKSSKRQPSVLNWMGSLLLYSIPGVNLIFLILSAFLAKSSSKRNFAVAGILLCVICALLTFLAFMFFKDSFVKLAEVMRQSVRDAMTPTGSVLPVA